jgi:hypothetical protein
MQPGLPWQRLGDIIPASKATEENELDQYFYRRKRAFTLSTGWHHKRTPAKVYTHLICKQV